MIKITVSVWAYNEENRIAKVLDSLQEFDDIIVFDKSSNDRTGEIAEKYGAKVVKVPYSDEGPSDSTKEEMINAYYSLADNEWVFFVVCSDIIHWKLYEEMKQFIEKDKGHHEVIEVPIYRYSMGAIGKNSYYGDLKFQADLCRRDVIKREFAKPSIVHEDRFRACTRCKLVPQDKKVAVYHLTHENLELVLERHTRYAKQYVEDWEKNGRNREQIMRYSWHEILRVVFGFFKHRVYKLKEVGMAQCMMLVMYNAMIYLNAFFDREQETMIANKYREIREECQKK